MSFNPRSHEGSDGILQLLPTVQTVFQSTLPRRERPVFDQLKFRLNSVSIHAPTKGATTIQMTDSCLYLFQSTLPRRERHFLFLLLRFYKLFQSKLPRRERHHRITLNLFKLWCFNPRSHEGSDSPGRNAAAGDQQFQSTLPPRERQIPH